MTTEYPHEWLWRKVREHQDFFIVTSVATVTVLVIGSAVMWAAVNVVPTTNVWSVQTMNQPSAFSYAPIFLCAALALLGIGIYSYYYGDEE